MLDKAEFHSFVIHKLLRFFNIKKIIENEKSSRIIISSDLEDIVNTLGNSKEIKFETLDKRKEEKLEYDKYSFIVNVGTKPISLNFSRKKFTLMKKILEKSTGKIFNLFYTPNNEKKVILMLEFNPQVAESLLESLAKTNNEIVLFNTRRPAAWNLESLRILRKNKIKLLNPEYFLNKQIMKEIDQKTIEFKSKFNDLMKNNKEFVSVFTIDEYPIWNLIRDKFIQTFNDRLYEYITLVILAKEFFNVVNVKCVLYLSAAGESETAMLNLKQNKSPSIIFEHGFANWTKESGKYDALSYYHFLRDKIAVWGNIQKDYLLSSGRIKEEKILTIGSPKLDNFFKKKHIPKTKKTNKILLTLHPINEYAGSGTIKAYQRLEEFVINFSKVMKNFSDLELIVKLHPGHTDSDDYVKKLFGKKFEKVKIFQITPISKLLNDCDILVNLSPESYDPSTVLLEAMIMEVPIIDMSLDDKQYKLEYQKDNAVLGLSVESNIEEEMKKFFGNEKLQEELINNGKKHVERYLVNIGNSSNEIAKIIDQM